MLIMMKKRLIVLIVITICFSTTSSFEDKSVLQWLTDNGYTTMVSVLTTVGLDVQLSASGSFTVFAPPEAAFSQLAQSLTSDRVELKRVLQYHIAKQLILVNLITDYMSVETLLKDQHITLHKVSGTAALVNNGTRTVAPKDIICNNGVILPIDRVLVPPAAHNLNIAQVLIRDDARLRDFTVELVVTGLMPILESGDYTLFVPSNAAFGALGIEYMDPHNPRPNPRELIDIMKYYIVPGGRTAEMLRRASDLYTIRGLPLSVTISGADSSIMINGARVIDADIMASNGVIHVIDDLLSTENYQNATSPHV